MSPSSHIHDQIFSGLQARPSRHATVKVRHPRAKAVERTFLAEKPLEIQSKLIGKMVSLKVDPY